MSDQSNESILPRPTDSELAILGVLWRRGASTVRQVHDELSQEQSTGYTTVLKLMQIMFEKGLVTRDETQRAHVYAPIVSEQKTQKQLLGDLLTRAFSGSMSKLVMQALTTQRTSEAELDEIRELLDNMAGDRR